MLTFGWEFFYFRSGLELRYQSTYFMRSTFHSLIVNHFQREVRTYPMLLSAKIRIKVPIEVLQENVTVCIVLIAFTNVWNPCPADIYVFASE